MSESLNDKVLAGFQKQIPEGSGLKIPPPSFIEMGGEIVGFEEGKSLRVRFPVRENYQNPTGMMQGGFIVAAIDNAVGPLSYLVAPPSATTQLNTSYLRPISPDEEFIEVEAQLATRAGKQLFITAEVFNAMGKVMAISHITQQILGSRKGA